MFDEWLIKRMTLEEVEAEHTVLDERLGPEPVVFGFQNARWKKFIAQMIPGDELWDFESPPETWEHLVGRAGIALVRKGEIIDEIVSMMN